MVITAEGEAEAARLISEALKTGRSRPGAACVCVGGVGWGGGGAWAGGVRGG